MPFRVIFFSFAKCENIIEVAGLENMTLIQRMAHVRTEVHKKLSFNDVDPKAKKKRIVSGHIKILN